MNLEAGMQVECVLDDGTRLGPVELVHCEGRHAVLELHGVAVPVPSRTLVRASAPRKNRMKGSSSGERLLRGA